MVGYPCAASTQSGVVDGCTFEVVLISTLPEPCTATAGLRRKGAPSADR